MTNGTIKKVVADRGFGFILPEGGSPDGKDLFFHRSDVTGSASFEQLRLGQTVEYELVTNRGKTSAENLKVS